jgi:two-component sensor histidine kinase
MTALPSQLPPPQEQLLLHELNHRIGNEFCCAISVVSLAAARSSDKEVKAALTEVAELLHHYAEVHHALQMPEHGIRTDVAAYLRKLFTARIPSVRPDSSASRVPTRLR